MEDNYFSENNKFFSLKGVLDRRGMVTNFFIVELVEAFFLKFKHDLNLKLKQHLLAIV